MNAREAEKLLGGYATGILTEAERSALFTAALSDQDLFDALADEETLRDLLSDPAMKARLMAALETKPKVIPFWRRPSSMTLAASLLVAIGATLMLKRQHPEEILPKPSRPAPVMEAAPPPKATVPEPAKASPKVDFRARVDKAPAPVEKKLAPPPLPPPPPSAPAPAEASLDAAMVQAPAERRESNKTAQGVAGGAVGAFMLARSKAPTWTWDKDATGHPRLTVSWGPGGHLYLLERSVDGARVLGPTSESEGRSVFSPSGTLPLDLYWSNAPVSHPENLPAEGPVAGTRVRIQPPQENPR